MHHICKLFHYRWAFGQCSSVSDSVEAYTTTTGFHADPICPSKKNVCSKLIISHTSVICNNFLPSIFAIPLFPLLFAFLESRYVMRFVWLFRFQILSLLWIYTSTISNACQLSDSTFLSFFVILSPTIFFSAFKIHFHWQFWNYVIWYSYQILEVYYGKHCNH